MDALRRCRTVARWAITSLIVGALVTACSDGAARQGQPVVTATGPSRSSITPLLASPSPPAEPLPTSTPAPPTTSCGVISEINSVLVDRVAAAQAEACFVQAFQQCDFNGAYFGILNTYPTGTIPSGLPPGASVVTAHQHHENYRVMYRANGCVIQVTVGESNEARNASDTPVAAAGAHIDFHGECSTLSRDASGRLGVRDCHEFGPAPDIDLPAV